MPNRTKRGQKSVAVDKVTHVVRRGIARTYVAHEDNLVFLRGKLLLNEHIRRNVANGARVFCSYDEYEANRPVNRLLRGALEVTRSLTRDSANQQLCNELLFWFNSVPPTADHRMDQQRMSRDRMVRHYDCALPPALMILDRLNPLTLQGEREALSMLFPMERVFEDYVASILRQTLRGWRVSTQVSGKHLVESHKGRPTFGLRPDLLLRQGERLVVADTKWKLLKVSSRNRNYGISQSDVYQMFAYCKRWLARQDGLKELVLIFPATSNFHQPFDPFWYKPEKEMLTVLPFDLNKQTLLGFAT